MAAAEGCCCHTGSSFNSLAAWTWTQTRLSIYMDNLTRRETACQPPIASSPLLGRPTVPLTRESV